VCFGIVIGDCITTCVVLEFGDSIFLFCSLMIILCKAHVE